MPSIPLNPGFVLILAGLIVLAAPRMLRGPIMALSALLGLVFLLENDFGAAAAVRQMGLPVVLLDLDALNRIFGIALLIALIAIAIFAHGRRNRVEDSAILIMAGGAVSALFVGDLVSFVAAAALSGLAGAWTVFCSQQEGSARAGARLLVWNGLEGLLLLVGVAFHLAASGGNSAFTRMESGTVGGAFLLAAFLMRIGAPFAHVWLKDTIAHASPLGGAALSVFAPIVGVYALAHAFPAEPMLAPIGAAMIVLGVVFAAASDDLRAAGGYGLTSQIGVCVALIGVGTPLSLAAAEGHAFTATLAFAAFQLACGAIVERHGAARLSRFGGMARAMPITCALLMVAGLTVSAMPGLSLYASLSVGLDAAAPWDLQWLWALIAGGAAALFVSLTLRPALAAHRRVAHPVSLREAPFSMLLGTALAAFFGISVGLAPDWLYGLMPADIAFAPFALDRVAPQFEMLGAAGVVFILLRAFGLAPKERALDLLDVDAFYRGPVANAGRWAGVVILRLYGAWQAALSILSARITAALVAWTRTWDRPYLGRSWAAVQFLALGIVLAIMLAGAQL
jgi:multicomponent Na+:H+ antiporter subunit D